MSKLENFLASWSFDSSPFSLCVKEHEGAFNGNVEQLRLLFPRDKGNGFDFDNHSSLRMLYNSSVRSIWADSFVPTRMNETFGWQGEFNGSNFTPGGLVERSYVKDKRNDNYPLFDTGSGQEDRFIPPVLDVSP